ncbi:MAG: O-antigen ligase family protein [Oscillospiraceae bacterium]|nr:O-antigen ligase family protein [Oscillospiraceae bacterium]
MKKQTVKLNRRIIFYSLFGLILVLVFVKYALQIGFPETGFLVLIAAAACLGTRDEIIAMGISLIPLQTAFHIHIATIILVAVYVFKFSSTIKINHRIISIALMVIWELLHCFSGEFSLVTFAGNFAPYLLLGILMWTESQKYDYEFITRCFAISTLAVGIMLLGKIGFASGFSLEAIMLNMQRLGIGEKDVESVRGIINPNTLGIICVLAVSGLLQIFIAKKKRISDVVLIITLLIIGALTISRTYLVLVAIMAVLFIMAQKRSLKSKIKIILGIAIIIIITLFLLSFVFPNVLKMFVYRFSLDNIVSGRDELLVAYNEFLLSDIKNMWFGVGLQDFSYKLMVQNRVAGNAPHNGIQEIIVAWGIPGFIFFMMFIFDLIASSRKVNRHQKLLNFIPFILIFAKIQAGQIITSGYTLLTLAYCYLSLCHDFYPDENDAKIGIPDK